MMAVALLVAAAVAGLIAYLVISEESAGPETGATLTDVVADPSRYEGERVSVSGEWAENPYFPADQADEIIVLGDDAENPLLWCRGSASTCRRWTRTQSLRSTAWCASRSEPVQVSSRPTR